MLETLTGSLEENVLTILCFDNTNAPSLAARITPDLFSTLVYRQIATVSINHLNRFQVPPAAHLRDLFEEKLRRGTDEGKLLRQTLDAMDSLAADIQADYVLAELDTFIRTASLSRALETAMECLNRGKLQDAQDALHEARAPATVRRGIWLHDTAQSLAFMDRPETEQMSSGVHVLDSKGCRPAKGEFFLWLAPPNYGKSWALVNTGKENIIRGKNVLHITMEMDEHSVAQRYVQQIFALSKDDVGSIRTPVFSRDADGRCTGMDFNQYDVRQLTEELRPELVNKMASLRHRGKLRIEYFPSGTLTIPQLAAFLDHLERKEGFVPDMVIADYWDLFKLDTDNLRISTGQVGVQLRGLAGLRNFAAVSASQIGRAGTKAKAARGTDVAEDYSKMMTTDYVVIYNQTEAEEKANLARLFVEKARGASKHYTVLLSQSYATGQFAIDNVLMDARVREHAKQMSGEKEDD